MTDRHDRKAVEMTIKDKLEIGLKEDAPYRKDNLPDFQVRGPEIPSGPGRSPTIPLAKGEKTVVRTRKARQAKAPRHVPKRRTR